MIAVCLKWVDQRPDAGVAVGADIGSLDARFAGVSAADRAALEWALRCRDAWAGETVLAVTVGPAQADTVLRDALAAGADRAIRIDAHFGLASHAAADSIAALVGDASLVFCGDYSSDRGSGSVPAFLAIALGFDQALGLVHLDIGAAASIQALRQLDGGRRERLAIGAGTVVSVEGSTALLRRAPLRALLATAAIDVHPGPTVAQHRFSSINSRPYRPRPRVLPAPVGATALDRVRALTASGTAAPHGETVTLEPADAAARILATLREWGYTPTSL